MSTKTMKILTFIVTVLLVVSIGGTTVFGATDKDKDKEATTTLTPSQMTGTPPTSTDIQDLGNKIIGILQTIGVVLSVVILVILGIKYMMGSAEEKAEYKKTMIPYIVGAAFIFLAPTIANVVYTFLTSSK